MSASGPRDRALKRSPDDEQQPALRGWTTRWHISRVRSAGRPRAARVDVAVFGAALLLGAALVRISSGVHPALGASGKKGRPTRRTSRNRKRRPTDAAIAAIAALRAPRRWRSEAACPSSPPPALPSPATLHRRGSKAPLDTADDRMHGRRPRRRSTRYFRCESTCCV